ncbi:MULTISPECIES: peptidylprolyl isomerase [unclassified Azospirillum]|uniref:peptidylprolyl isomerase n=1 Tax=unclassified Azospirillum TaxID=2630922 RepID=UPI000B730F31|nr:MULTISPECIES: peptidylprolyl isomerase [unclassified Azospirillum]SNS34828.1 periplasmic chaperone for outer membrane proteins SurA [Azospirillum sp. RU38E]SNS53226.1 periplasmic chaperone for outer membrane proteins SurA [Azospirillum sp. RU37A]
MMHSLTRRTMTSFLRKALLGATAFALVAVTVPAGRLAHAQQAAPLGRIAAVVNESPITQADVEGRLQLAIVSSGLPDTPDTRKRLLPQVIRILTDEALQVQEARERKLSVTEDELNNALSEMAERNRMTRDQLQQALQQAGVPWSTMRQQMLAQLAWSKVVQRVVRQQVNIPDSEVNAYIERIRANAGKPEYQVAEIFLAVDNPANEQEVQNLADRLVDQIGKGANFAAVAQQFSQSAGAATGGDLGWIQQGQLEEALDRALQQLHSGQFSRPIRGAAGYHILWLRDQRTVAAGDPKNIQISLGQFVVPAPSDPNQQGALFDAVKQLGEGVKGCEALQQAASKIHGAQVFTQPLTKLGDIPEQIAGLVAGLGVGNATQPLVTDRGTMLLMVCDRVVPEGSLPPPDQVRSALFQERMDLQQRRYLRDLRRQATIETRL